MDLIAVRRMILRGANGLPPGYQRLAYIRNDITTEALIHTDYWPVLGDEFDIVFSVAPEAFSGYNCLFSVGSGVYQTIVQLSSSKNTFYCRYFKSSGAASFRPNLTMDTMHRMTVSSSGVFTVNGNSTTSTPDASAIDGTYANLHVFGRYNGNDTFHGKLASFKVRNSDGVLKLNLVPCKRKSDNKVGVYDTIANAFYYSASSDDFTDV